MTSVARETAALYPKPLNTLLGSSLAVSVRIDPIPGSSALREHFRSDELNAGSS